MTKKEVSIQNTVYVIGAGASKEANLPTGHELKEKIIQALDIRSDYTEQISGDAFIKKALHIHFKCPYDDPGYLDQKIIDAASRFQKGLPLSSSIDNFINQNPCYYNN